MVDWPFILYFVWVFQRTNVGHFEEAEEEYVLIIFYFISGPPDDVLGRM